MKKCIQTVAVFFAAVCLLSCGENNKPAAGTTAQPDSITPVIPVKEDSLTTKLRPVLFDLENQELSFNGRKPFDLTISDIRYSVISMKDYYTAQQAILQGQAKYSTNKEKTGKALAWLVKMIGSSSAKPEIYLVQFHMKAQVDKTFYNEEKNIYLKKDFSPLQLIFPQ